MNFWPFLISLVPNKFFSCTGRRFFRKNCCPCFDELLTSETDCWTSFCTAFSRSRDFFACKFFPLLRFFASSEIWSWKTCNDDFDDDDDDDDDAPKDDNDDDEDLYGSKAGLGDLLVLVEQMPPDVEDVVLGVRWSNFNSFRSDI